MALESYSYGCLIIPDFRIIGIQDPGTQHSTVLWRKEIFQGARKHSNPSCITENATKPQIILCDSLWSSWYFCYEKMMQFEFVFLFLMQFPIHQIFFIDILNIFHWK